MNIAECLKDKQEAADRLRREKALEALAKYRGRCQALKFIREACYDR
jgi:hypothetical protein